MGTRTVSVLYEVFEGGGWKNQDFNGFDFENSTDEEVLLGDLMANLPPHLGNCWHWSIFNHLHNMWVDAFNPATPISVQDGYLVRARLLPLASPPLASKEAVRAQGRRAPHPCPPPGSTAAAAVAAAAAAGAAAPPAAAPRGGGGGGGVDWQEHAGRLQDQVAEHAERLQEHGEKARRLLGQGLRAARTRLQDVVSAVAGGEATVGHTRVRLGRELAEGGFSKVFLARSLDGSQEYALKQIICYEKEAIEEAQKELGILRQINHPNVIRVLDAGMSDYKPHPGAKDIMLLFPYYPRGTVWDQMVAAMESGAPWPLTERRCLQLFHGTCLGVAELHKIGFVHRDLKPLNVLLSERGAPVVMDVGSAARGPREVRDRREAMLMEDEATAKCSAPYRPPELTQVEVGVVLDGAIDVWSLGCTLFCFAFGHSPFETPSEGISKLGILSARFRFPNGNEHRGQVYSTDFCGFITQMLQTDPRQRPKINDVIQRTMTLLTG